LVRRAFLPSFFASIIGILEKGKRDFAIFTVDLLKFRRRFSASTAIKNGF